MTTTILRVIEIKDIVTIRASCSNCKATVSLPIGSLGRLPFTCPGCTQRWANSQHIHEAVDALSNAVRMLRAINESTMDGAKLEITLEIANDGKAEVIPA